MKKPLNKLDRPGLKHLFSRDLNSPKVISKAEVRKNKSLKPLDPKGLKSRVSRKSNDSASASGARAPSSRSRKSPKKLNTNDTGFLASQDARTRSANKLSVFVRLHIFLLVIGLLGSAACLWAMVYTAHSEQLVSNLGMQRVANSLENILSVLALPVLLFTIVLSAYAIQQLYIAYRRANYLDNDRRP